MTEPEPEPLEGELLCYGKSAGCLLSYGHDGLCKPKSLTHDRSEVIDPSQFRVTNSRFRAGPSPVQMMMGNIFAAAMNAGVQDATITSDVRGVRLHGHMAEPDDQPKEIDG